MEVEPGGGGGRGYSEESLRSNRKAHSEKIPNARARTNNRRIN